MPGMRGLSIATGIIDGIGNLVNYLSNPKS